MIYYLLFVLIFVKCECFNNGYNKVWGVSHYKYSDYDKIRPCPHFELNCIRAFFKEHSTCTVSHGPVPDPILFEKYKFYLAHANMTYELRNTSISGLNGRIVEFYINKKTHKLILAAEMQEVALEAALTVAKYARKAKEPIELNDAASGNYGTVTFTTVFPDMMNLQLSEAETSSYIEDSNLRYYLGAKMTTSSDSAVHEMLDTVRKNLGLDLRESFAFQGHMFMGMYIQHMICNFGMKYEDFFVV